MREGSFPPPVPGSSEPVVEDEGVDLDRLEFDRMCAAYEELFPDALPTSDEEAMKAALLAEAERRFGNLSDEQLGTVYGAIMANSDWRARVDGSLNPDEYLFEVFVREHLSGDRRFMGLNPTNLAHHYPFLAGVIQDRQRKGGN